MSRGVTQPRLTQRVAGPKIPKAYCIAGGIRTLIQADYAAFIAYGYSKYTWEQNTRVVSCCGVFTVLLEYFFGLSDHSA